MTFWMSPFRRGMRNGKLVIIADVAPSRVQRKQSREITFDPAELIALPREARQRTIAQAVAAKLADFDIHVTVGERGTLHAA